MDRQHRGFVRPHRDAYGQCGMSSSGYDKTQHVLAIIPRVTDREFAQDDRRKDRRRVRTMSEG